MQSRNPESCLHAPATGGPLHCRRLLFTVPHLLKPTAASQGGGGPHPTRAGPRQRGERPLSLPQPCPMLGPPVGLPVPSWVLLFLPSPLASHAPAVGGLWAASGLAGTILSAGTLLPADIPTHGLPSTVSSRPGGRGLQPKVRTPTLGPALLPPHGGRPGGQAPRQTRTCPSCQLEPAAPSARLVSRAWREGVGRRPAVAGDGPPPRGSMVPPRAERRAGLPGARAQRDAASEAQARVPGWTASPVSRSRADAGGAAVRQPSPASQGTVGVPTGGLAHTAAPGTSDCV